MGVGLIVLSGLELPGVVRSGLVGLLGLEGKKITSEYSEDGSLSVSSEGGSVGERFFFKDSKSFSLMGGQSGVQLL